MNVGTALAPDVQDSSHRIGFTLVTLLGRLVFNHHNGVHGDVALRIAFFMTAPAWKEEERPALTNAAGL